MFFLLAQLPVAGRATDPAAALAHMGIKVEPTATAAELCSAMLAEADRRLGIGGEKFGIAELAVLSAGEALYGAFSVRSEDLFDGRPAMKALGELRTFKNLGELTKTFLSRSLRRSLDYYLGPKLNQRLELMALS